jgi:hypothetical protein
MNDQHREDPASPLTPEERDALDAFQPAGPSDLLRQRIVDALRDEGILGARSARRGPRPVTQWTAAAVAAVALFLGGFSLGSWWESRDVRDALVVSQRSQHEVTAAWIQQLGSAYVGALARLASQRGENATAGDVGQSEAVARAAVIGAVAELVKLNPRDVELALVLELLDTGSPPPGVVVRTVSF